MAQMSPMMQQYLRIKEENKDAILFFRLGDFYEMFFDDALLASRELDLTLTGRDCGQAERAPMCGVPYHSADTYISRLVEKGYKVAICEQTSDPALSKGLVDREVMRIVTPGTVTEPSMLAEKRNNYLVAISVEDQRVGVAFTDVTTGEFSVFERVGTDQSLADLLASITPTEIVGDEKAISACAHLTFDAPISPYAARAFQYGQAKQAVLSHFHAQDLMSLGLTDWEQATRAAGALLSYLQDTQRNAMEHIHTLRIHPLGDAMLLDTAARRNLELTENLRRRDKGGTLLGLLDHTATAMGGRLLRAWVEQPLLRMEAIQARLSAVQALKEAHVLAQSLYDSLRGVHDIERLLSRISYKTIHGRDCLALCASFERIPAVKDLVKDISAPLIAELCSQLDPLEDLTDLLTRMISPDAPLQITGGGVIRDGYSEELDELRAASSQGKQWILELEAREREATGIKTLRINYNRVFGFYIEVTKSYYSLVPYRFTRRQTLANCERFTTQELHELEQRILGAEDKAMKLEQVLFAELREHLSGEIPRIQVTARALKTLDALLSLALAAIENDYVRPEMNDAGVIEIQNGRHPVVEKSLRNAQFVPNDTAMDLEDNRVLIVTGPNMAGKSTYMRQVALITLMAHIGSFVPAERANITLTDRIFTRIGASDDLASGQSTFMVEMSEMANILRNATSRSLLILDEIGRGTSTFDGLSIAWSIVEHVCDPKRVGAKTLFATHYHELSELEGKLPGVVNYYITIKEHGEDIIFLRKIMRGGADKSFGIHVARLAGLPQPVVARAHEILARLEAADINQNSIGQNILEQGRKQRKQQVSMTDFEALDIVEELRRLDVMSITPMDAMNHLFRLREKARRI